MKIGPIIHQQVFQLKWHFLACLGLIMVLPLEEGFVNLKDGEGFYSSNLTMFTVFLSPFLAALIACANVQADLDDKRYLFWRSKPLGVKSFMILKYAVGLLMAFVMIACPILFTYISCEVVHGKKIDLGIYQMIIIFQVISLLAYSLCFLSNVLIRKTALAWLIGMALTGFLLLVPFILPLNLKETGDVLEYLIDKARPSICILILFLVAVAPSLLALTLSLIAVARNWHLKTNLKGLLWTGAAIIFLLFFFFAHQVANIKELDEIEIPNAQGCDRINTNNGKVVFGGRYEVETENDQIHLNDIYVQPSEALRQQQQDMPRLYEVEKGLHMDIYPLFGPLPYKIGNDNYSFNLVVYYRQEKQDIGWAEKQYIQVYLCSYKQTEGIHLIPVSALDLSDCLSKNSFDYFAVRLIEDKIVALVADQCVTVAIGNPAAMTVLSREPTKRLYRAQADRNKIFKIPLIPTTAISIQERIRFVIDFTESNRWLSDHSWVDIHNNKISFTVLSEHDIARYDVIRWDNDYVYCKFRDVRPFTVLEQMFSQINWICFVKNGKFYVNRCQNLMVFDVRSEHIRKLGHWERISKNFGTNDIEVLDNGNILMAIEEGKLQYIDGRKQTKYKTLLYLLKNPE